MASARQLRNLNRLRVRALGDLAMASMPVCPQWLELFSIHGSDEQMFGAE